jgi:hypothetical protein
MSTYFPLNIASPCETRYHVSNIDSHGHSDSDSDSDSDILYEASILSILAANLM